MIVLEGRWSHGWRAMKHRIHTKLGRQFGKSLSKTTKFAVRKSVGQAKEQPSASKVAGCMGKADSPMPISSLQRLLVAVRCC